MISRPRRAAVLFAFSAAGCVFPPTVTFEAANPDGMPRSGVPVTFSCTRETRLVLEPGKADAPHAEGTTIDGKTDAEGRITVGYWLPRPPSFFERLFGAEPAPTQSVDITYSNPDGSICKCTVEMR